MSRFARVGPQAPKIKIVKEGEKGLPYVDYKDVETLRRMMSPNGKIYARKRIGATAREQRLISQAIKRARFMALMPYVGE